MGFRVVVMISLYVHWFYASRLGDECRGLDATDDRRWTEVGQRVVFVVRDLVADFFDLDQGQEKFIDLLLECVFSLCLHDGSFRR